MKNFLSKIFNRKAAKPPEEIKKVSPHNIQLYEEPGTGQVVFKNLVLLGVDKTVMVDYGDLTLSPGDRMMISGPAGCGKSAGLAAMRNAWLLGGSGEISVPPEVRFVAQEEYFPDRSLRGIICAPDDEHAFTDAQVAQALTDAGLAEFIPDMNDQTKRGEYWKNTMSGGQKNKLSFAGIFLHADQVKVLVVDEITAALDVKSETILYPRLLERMKHGIVITVAHHATLSSLHNVFGVVADHKVTYTRTSETPVAAPPVAPKSPAP
ncbi:MAG: ATP-binding cassette domain-containing protein [Alphaproteobacteria bacterium]